MSDEGIHLVLGDVAAGVLGEAMDSGLLARAEILRFRDIYCLGPLGGLGTPEGPASRARYWAQLLPEAPPAIAEFEDEEARYRRARDAAAGAPLHVWIGDHSSSRLWLQRLASMVSASAPDLGTIETVAAVSGGKRRRALGQFEPRETPSLLQRRRHPGAAEWTQLAGQWQHDAAIPSGVRRWIQGRMSHHGDDFYDPLLLAQCSRDWQPAGQVIGSAQWECDEFLGDVFFAWRLRALAGSGRIEWRGPGADLHRAEVRVSGAGH